MAIPNAMKDVVLVTGLLLGHEEKIIPLWPGWKWVQGLLEFAKAYDVKSLVQEFQDGG
jgi:hypothetical protein